MVKVNIHHLEIPFDSCKLSSPNPENIVLKGKKRNYPWIHPRALPKRSEALSKTHPQAILPQLDRLNAQQIPTKVGISINLSITHAPRVVLNFKLWKFLWGRLNIYSRNSAATFCISSKLGDRYAGGIAE
ncbi:hypothetical protein CDAR_529931 [Caerostris darwini]|uniref:Uncharacterized protein n=1 Tax=Caerostris darwini TaxID=1538125 RepID=A0AAV4WZ60_9ARAC|nr:hypothetical protein CDAR_529931 [Caerostris darwini]